MNPVGLLGFILSIFLTLNLAFGKESLCQNITCSKSCEELSDSFCDYLWGDGNLGNLSFTPGENLFLGRTKEGLITQIEYLNLKALIDNKCRLPKELKTSLKVNCDGKAEDWFDQFNKFLENRDGVDGHLQREKWVWKLNDFKTRFKRATSFAANKRTLNKYPELKNKLWEELLDKEKSLYMEDYFDMKSAVVDAKYADHPNFLRIKAIFAEAQEDILKVVDTMPVESVEKDKMKAKVRTIRLMLPYEDPRTVAAVEECGKNTQNAYYIPSRNIFTICAGYLNGYQVEGHLYRVIAHEISHAIDPQQFAKDKFKETGLSKLLAEVYKGNGQLDCKDWEAKKSEAFLSPSNFLQLPEKLTHLNKCLMDNKELNELTLQSLEVPTNVFTSKKIHKYAHNKLFTLLARPEIYKKGKLIPNQYYLNPLLVEARQNQFLYERYYEKGYFHIGSVFVQSLKCNLENYNSRTQASLSSPSLPSLGSDIPSEVFEKSIHNTEEMFKVFKKTLFSFVGRNDKYLQFHDLAQPVDEAWADWMATNAMRLKLQRTKDKDQKRVFVLSTQAKFCGKNGLERLSAEHLQIEKGYSKQAHPLRRSRRLSYLLPEFSKMLDCTPGPEIKKLAGACQL